MPNFFLYLLILSGSTYLIRAIPFACVKRTIENTFIRSFLYYIPYAVLAAMTFPAVIYSKFVFIISHRLGVLNSFIN